MWALMTIVPFSTWAQTNRDRTISGKLIFDTGATCERVRVELEVAEMQPIETVYADPTCTFKFLQPGNGNYLIHIDVDGYEEIHQRVEASGVDGDGYSVIQMIPAPGRVSTKAEHTQASVDVSEMMNQYPKKAVNLFNKALDAHKKQKDPEAIEHLQEALKIAPDFYPALNLLGCLYRDAGQFDKAEEQFVHAHSVNGHNPEPLVNLSSLYLQEDKPERAAEVSQEAVLENARSAPALFNLGLAMYKMSKLDKAEDALKRALDIAPKMSQIHLALANVYLKWRKYDNLLDQLNAYLQQNPNGPQRDQVQKLRDQVLKAKSEGNL
jgi:tetratricopeptide (TPR) repeat protein